MDLWGNEDEDEYRARKRAEIFSSSYHFENYGMLENAIHRCRLCPLCDEGGRGPAKAPAVWKMSTAGRWSGRQDSCWIKLFCR